MLLKLVRTFGSVIYSTLSATTSVGVDIEAEQRFVLVIFSAAFFHELYINLIRSFCYVNGFRLERCNLCFIELEKIKRVLPSLTRYVFMFYLGSVLIDS